MLIYRRRARDRTLFPRPEDMPPLLHALLIERGISSEAEARVFLNPGAHGLGDPMRLPSMAEAVSRMRRAVERREKICIYGDYDVDGVGAAAILYLHLQSVGAHVTTYLPSRHGEGYGLNEGAVRALAADVALLVTVDCGINAAELVELAKALGMDVIVTDHHRPGDALPDCPVVNPLLGDGSSAPLSGAGVAWKLVEALSGRAAALEYIDIAALSTVADVVPLVGENRSIVALGLARMNARPRAGIRALCEVAGISEKPLTAGQIAFQIGPRLNAGGRLGSAGRALKLLLTDDASEAQALARELDAENAERRRVEAEILEQAEDMLNGFDFPRHRAIVLEKEGWNAGVLGLAASRLAERWHHPAILLTPEGGVLKGSCRSIPGVDIFAALSRAGEHLSRFGGHSQAAGLALPAENLDAFRASLDRVLFEDIPPSAYIPSLAYDLPAALSKFDAYAVASLAAMEPTGMGNPSPVFRARAKITSARGVGRGGAHLKLTVESDDSRLGGVFFSQGARADALSGEYDMLFAPKINAWMGRADVELELRALEPVDANARILAKQPERDALVVRFLTEVLYNREMKAARTAAISALELREAISRDVQGTLMIARDMPQAMRALEVLEDMRIDLFIGAYPTDPRAFSALCVLPAGEHPRNYRTVLSAEDIDGAPSAAWLRDLPDVGALRDVYRALRSIARRPAHYAGLLGLSRLAAAACDAPPMGCAAAILALADMDLVAIERESARFKMLPMEKKDPHESAVFQKILRLRAEGREGSGDAR